MSSGDNPAYRAPKLDRWTKVLYGSGAMAIGAKLQIFGLLLLFYNQIVGMPAELVSLAIGISMVVDAAWDPLIGQISDKLRTPWGRRHPLMYASVVPTTLAFALLWHPPAGWSDTALFGYLLSMTLIVRFATSLFEVPSTALAPELAPDYDDRTVLLSYRFFFNYTSGALAAILAYGIFLRATPEYPMGQLNPAGYSPLAIATALLMGGAILISALGTHHKIPSFHRPRAEKMKLAATFREVGATLRNWNFGVTLASGLIGGMAAGLMGGLTIYFNTYFWELPSISILMLVLVSLVSTPVAAVLAPAVARLWGKRNANMAVFTVAVLANGAPIFLRLIDFFPENGSPALVPLLMLGQVVAGSFGIAGYILSASMTADIVEEVQLKTGHRAEGLLLSAESLLLKMVSGLGVALPGLILAMVAFPQKATPGAVDPDVLQRLGWIYIPAVTILAMGSVLVRWFYRIDRAAHEQNLTSIRDGVAAAETQAEALEAVPEGASTASARV